VYGLYATFSTAGQGLGARSDVKIHGVNIGQVKHVTLRNGRARVKMEINRGQKVPVDSSAVIRPKTLFGEKFIDINPGAQEATGPFLRGGQTITNTLGGFELERVLSDAYPILNAIRPEDLTVVLDTLAKGGEGEGTAVNRALDNFRKVADVQAAHDADTRQFLDDLANLSQTLADHAGDVVGAASSLNSALPAINQRGDEVTSVLQQLSRLSNDVADVLDANRTFQDKAVVEGGQSLALLAGRSKEIGPLLTGLRQYFQVQAIVGWIPLGDGTTLAAVKDIAGGDCPQGQVNGCSDAATAAAGAKGQRAGTTAPAPAGVAPSGPAAGSVLILPSPSTGANAIERLVRGLLG
jgi:phospholipid/cholesterol/gamma-HCH transport system substrate-binding protein